MGPLEMFRAYLKGKRTVRDVEQALPIAKLAIGKRLLLRFSGRYPEDVASVYAAQVMNYLTGNDIQLVFEQATEPLKSKLSQVIEYIPEVAIIEMRADPELRRTVLATLFWVDAIQHAKGSAYLGSRLKAQVDAVQSVFPQEQYADLDSGRYLRLVKDFAEAGV